MREEGCPINFAAGKTDFRARPGDTFRGRSKIKRFFFFSPWERLEVAAGIQDKFLIWQWFFCRAPPLPPLLLRQGAVENVQKVGREKGKKREKKRKTRGWNKIKESHRWPVTFYRVNVGSERERKRWKGGREREREEWRRKKMWKVRQAENYRDLFVRSHSNRADVGMSSCLFCRNSYKTVLISCRQ